MKKLSIIALTLVISLSSCKKDKLNSLYGTWIGVGHSTQFTIDNLDGKGKSNFILKGDQLKWKFNDSVTIDYTVKFVREETMTLVEKGEDKYFLRLN